MRTSEGGWGIRAHGTRYTERINVMCFDLEPERIILQPIQ